MQVIFNLLLYTSTFVFGIFIGALLAEGALLVPYWRSLAPDDFFKLHGVFGPRLYRFYAPLTISATLLSVASMVASILISDPNVYYLMFAAILAILMVLIYFVYFQKANASFASRTVKPNDLKAELERWAFWHWARVGVGLFAFASLLRALESA